MPLSPPAARSPIHARRIECRGYRRDDGLWDIEGHLVDTKDYAFDNAHRGRIEAGEPLHDMWLRLTVDDGLKIVTVEAVTDAAPFGVCDAITPAFRQLEGLTIRAGFNRKVRELLGGVRGCTHLVDLLGPVATTAYQTIFPILSRERAAGTDRPAQPSSRRPGLLDSCHAFASDGEIVRRTWPAWYTGPEAVDQTGGPEDTPQGTHRRTRND